MKDEKSLWNHKEQREKKMSQHVRERKRELILVTKSVQSPSRDNRQLFIKRPSLLCTIFGHTKQQTRCIVTSSRQVLWRHHAQTRRYSRFLRRRAGWRGRRQGDPGNYLRLSHECSFDISAIVMSQRLVCWKHMLLWKENKGKGEE